MTKRRHKRFSIVGVATLQFEDEGKKKSIQGVIGSISSVGIGLYVDNPIEANKQLSITVHFISIGSGMQRSVIEGSVVYNKDLDKYHFMGIQFAEAVNSQNQPLLYEHIQNILAFNK